MLGEEIVERIRLRLIELQRVPDTQHGDLEWLRLRCDDTLGLTGGDEYRQRLSLRQLKKDVASFHSNFPGLLALDLVEALESVPVRV